MAGAQHTGDLFKQILANQVEERVVRIKMFVNNKTVVSRDELSRFVWKAVRNIYSVIDPNQDDSKQGDAGRKRAWMDAMGMLKKLIDWPKFNPKTFYEPCVLPVLEREVMEVLEAYKTFVLTGEIVTKYPPPKLLGETDEILCVDKPCMYTCNYGDAKIPDLVLKDRPVEDRSCSMLLNGEKPEIQIHEYLALKYPYENARGTREWWGTKPEVNPCHCGTCEICACTQSGCCNRLDKETSGVMIVAKTRKGFGEIRRQFASEHSLESGGMEKYYLCLCHGNVQLPAKNDDRSPHWKHTVVDGRGRIEVALFFDKTVWRSNPWDDTVWESGRPTTASDKPKGDCQSALTFYQPVAWFNCGSEVMTLCFLQIITGRTHQIRFHMQQVGHPLVGDTTYGAPHSDRGWCPRVFLHSYNTKFREPNTAKWYEATSPLPQDLCEVMVKNLGEPTKTASGLVFKSRRKHPELAAVLTQYDPSKPLLFTHAAPENKDEVIRKHDAMRAMAAAGQNPKKFVNADTVWGDGKVWSGGSSGSSNGTWQASDWKQDDSEWQASSSSSWSASVAGGDSWGGTAAGKGAAKALQAPAEPPPSHVKPPQAPAGPPPAHLRNGTEAAPAVAVASTAVVGVDDDDDDDDWGGWSAPDKAKKRAAASSSGAAASGSGAEEPAYKRLRSDENAGDAWKSSWQSSWEPGAQKSWQEPSEPPRAHPEPPRVPEPPRATQRQPPQQPQQPPQQPPQQQVQQLPPPMTVPGAAPRTPPAANPAQAGWKRMESRKQKGIFYYWNSTTSLTQEDPPAPWQKMQSRSKPGTFYYHNLQTGQNVLDKPEV